MIPAYLTDVFITGTGFEPYVEAETRSKVQALLA